MGSVAKLIRPMEGSDRVLFQPERPVLAFMEGFVNGSDDLDVRHELTVQILTQIRDNLALIGKKQDTFGTELHAVSERVVRLEERNERFTRLEAAIERAEGRLDVLMAEKLKREGAIGVVEWVSKHWPFTILSAAILAMVAWANGKLGG